MFEEASEQAAQPGRSPITPWIGGRELSDDEFFGSTPWSGFATPGQPSLQEAAVEVHQQRVDAAMSVFAGGQENNGNGGSTQEAGRPQGLASGG